MNVLYSVQGGRGNLKVIYVSISCKCLYATTYWLNSLADTNLERRSLWLKAKMGAHCPIFFVCKSQIRKFMGLFCYRKSAILLLLWRRIANPQIS
jgi:hypothetical protein